MAFGERHRHVLRVLEAGPRRDRGQRQLGLPQKLLDTTELHPCNLLVRRVADPFCEPVLERPSGGRQRPGDVGHLDAVACMVADLPHGRHHERVVDGQNVGALPGGDAQRRQEPLALLERFAPHHLLQKFGGQPAGPDCIRHHARERRTRQATEHVVVVHSQHRHLVRHGDPGPPAGVDRLPAAVVVAGQECDRLGQPLQPCLDRLVVVGWRGCATARKNRRVVSLRRHSLHEGPAAVVAPLKTVVPKKREVSKVAFDEVVGGSPRDRRVVGLHIGQVGDQPRRTDVDHRNSKLPPQLLDRLGGGFRLDPRDHAVAGPRRERLQRRRTPPMLRQEDRPRLMLPHVPQDARQEASRVGIRCLDDDGHAAVRSGVSWHATVVSRHG